MKRTLVIGGAIAAIVIVAAVIVFLVPFGGPSEQEARQKADQLFVTFREQGGEATYKTVVPEGEGMVLKDLTLKTPAKSSGGKARTVTIDELRIRELDWNNAKQPDFADIEFRNMRVDDIKADPEFREFSTVTGLDDLIMSGRLKYRLDQDKKLVTVDQFRMLIDGMGEYTMSMTFEGVNIPQLREAAQSGQLQGPQALGLLSSIQLRSLSIAYKDSGGTEKFLKFAAKKENSTADDVRKKALAQLDAAGQAMKGKLAQEAITAAQKFLKDPGTIKLVANPSSPVAILPVVMGAVAGGANPAALDSIKSQLNLTIAAE